MGSLLIPSTRNLRAIKIEERSWQILMSSRVAGLSGIERTDSLLDVSFLLNKDYNVDSGG